MAGRADGSRPAPLVGLVVASIVSVALGRWAGKLFPTIAPLVLAAGIASVLLASLPTLPHPDGAPLGYANANASLAGLGVLAALGGALAARSPSLSRAPSGRTQTEPRDWVVYPAAAVAAILAVLVAVPTSAASVLTLATVVVLGSVALWRGDARIAVVGGALVVVAVLVVTVAIALGADPVGLGTRSEARGDLWACTYELARDHPWSGIGPGAFAEHNPVTEDSDLRWAHHDYLQAAAELGLPGATLLFGLIAWAYGRLWLTGTPPRSSTSARYQRRVNPAVVVGAGAVTLVAVHATVDYVAHFPALVLLTALTLGWATVAPPDL